MSEHEASPQGEAAKSPDELFDAWRASWGTLRQGPVYRSRGDSVFEMLVSPEERAFAERQIESREVLVRGLAADIVSKISIDQHAEAINEIRNLGYKTGIPVPKDEIILLMRDVFTEALNQVTEGSATEL